MDDPECIGGAIFIKKSKIKDTDNHVYLYRFDEQNFKLKEGDTACDVTSDLSFGKVTKIDEIKDDENYIELTITITPWVKFLAIFSTTSLVTKK